MSGKRIRVLLLDGDGFRWRGVSPVVAEALRSRPDIDCTVTSDKGVLLSDALRQHEVFLVGSGFMGRQQTQGGIVWVPEFSEAQTESLFDFVSGGGGLAAFHATAWSLTTRYVDLLGGHANVHPKMSAEPYEVRIDPDPHPATAGVSSFTVMDEVYMTAWDPTIRILARTELAGPQWAGKTFPVAWARAYGKGRVFYTTLGHHAASFDHPEARRLVANGVAWAGGAG
jgi:type 1 glutamine amidotransferase